MERTLRARAHWPLCSTTCGRVFVAGIFIPVGNHYFQALASTLQFVAQVCDRLWLVPATDRAFAYITYMSPPHVALVCSGPPQKRGHMWLNKVASVLGPKKIPYINGTFGKYYINIRFIFNIEEKDGSYYTFITFMWHFNIY